MLDWSRHPCGAKITYNEAFTDTDKWDSFPHQPGEIFICTPAKNGTTWMQTIVTFLVFGTCDVDFVPADRSPWFDFSLHSVEESLSALNADDQRHIIKTHTPLDGVPWFEDTVYIGVYRDPRDAFFSKRNHFDNMNLDAGRPEMSVEDHWNWYLEQDFEPGMPETSLASVMHHFRCLWALRDRPNVHIFHYNDLKRDLVGQMRTIAKAIDVYIDDTLLKRLAEAATFSNMKKKPENFVPGAKTNYWKDPSKFLNKGQSKQWKGHVSDAMLAQFDARMRDLVSDDMTAFLRNGWGDQS